MQMREFTGYHVRKDHHHNSAVNLDHHNMKATSQYITLISAADNPSPFSYISYQPLFRPCLYCTVNYCNGMKHNKNIILLLLQQNGATQRIYWDIVIHFFAES